MKIQSFGAMTPQSGMAEEVEPPRVAADPAPVLVGR